MFWIPSKVRKTFRLQKLVTDFLVQKFEKVIMRGQKNRMGDHKFVDPFPLLLSLWLSRANHKRQLCSPKQNNVAFISFGQQYRRAERSGATIESCICSSHAIVNKYRTHWSCCAKVQWTLEILTVKLTVNGEINNENLAAAADQLMDQNPFLETTMIADRLLLNWTQFNQKDEKNISFAY